MKNFSNLQMPDGNNQNFVSKLLWFIKKARWIVQNNIKTFLYPSYAHYYVYQQIISVACYLFM